SRPRFRVTHGPTLVPIRSTTTSGNASWTSSTHPSVLPLSNRRISARGPAAWSDSRHLRSVARALCVVTTAVTGFDIATSGSATSERPLQSIGTRTRLFDGEVEIRRTAGSSLLEAPREAQDAGERRSRDDT